VGVVVVDVVVVDDYGSADSDGLYLNHGFTRQRSPLIGSPTCHSNTIIGVLL